MNGESERAPYECLRSSVPLESEVGTNTIHLTLIKLQCSTELEWAHNQLMLLKRVESRFRRHAFAAERFHTIQLL